MTVAGVDVHEDTYLDSLLLMATTVRMDELDGVEWAGAVMATPSGLADLAAAGFTGAGAATASARTTSCSPSAPWTRTCSRPRWRPGARPPSPSRSRRPDRRRARRGAAAQRAGGGAARLAARTWPSSRCPASTPRSRRTTRSAPACTSCCSATACPLDEEVELKERAVPSWAGWSWAPARAPRCSAAPASVSPTCSHRGRGRPGRGRGRRRGRHRRAGGLRPARPLGRAGVSQVIGVGGRDLSDAVGGRMARAAVRALDAATRTPAWCCSCRSRRTPSVAAAVLAECRGHAGASPSSSGCERRRRCPPGVHVRTHPGGGRAGRRARWPGSCRRR